MLRPSDRKMYRIARLVMRTHAVPMPVSTNGRSPSATAISTVAAREAAGCWRHDAMPAAGVLMGRPAKRRSCAIAHALAEQSRRPEDQHGDQHEEREHVLVVAPEERQVGILLAPLRDGHRIVGELAQIGEVADVAGAERLDYAEQQAAEHGATEVPDAAEDG